ncbi:hypothetical protein Cgig2_000052 [Carnegiea gigantea]|uniref:Non-specific serine/threonine protein kinase n=1 Tax=Carnegiea gigantea TaxID=171969 RepID=A0A9Q1L0X0_9CARY|nr:hypothetical protein Cgig2_000052 [Carnegiea gigantea]
MHIKNWSAQSPNCTIASINLNGYIGSTTCRNPLNLASLSLKNNSLNGSIPKSLSFLTSLQEADMSHNKFSGQLNEFEGSMLKNPHLSSNNLEGCVLKSLFQLRSLQTLDLSRNKFNGTPKVYKILHLLPNLIYLDPSNNYLSINKSSVELDILKSSIQGTVPKWIWKIGDDLYYSTKTLLTITLLTSNTLFRIIQELLE